MNDTREFTLTALFFMCFTFVTGVFIIIAVNAPLEAWLVRNHVYPGLVQLAIIMVMGLWAAAAIMITSAFYRRFVMTNNNTNIIIVSALIVIAALLMWYLISIDSYIIKPLLHKRLPLK